MSLLADLKMYGRFAGGLRGFLRQSISLEGARALVRQRLAEREANFLRLVEKGIFGYPRSPYRPLLKLAGVEFGDIRSLLSELGLDDTLRALHAAGVYITYEEFKGRKPIVRHGQLIQAQPEDFDNPFVSRHYQAESGGSTGAGTRVTHDLEHQAALAPHHLLFRQANGLLGLPSIVWRGILPDASGLNNVLRGVYIGQPPEKWFSPIGHRDVRPSLKYRLATYYTVLAGRLLGAPIPWPEVVPIDQAVVVARWVAQTLKARGGCLVLTTVSRALRACLAAREAGLDLSGAAFIIAGEPVTEAKAREISRSGAHYFSTYGFTEAGRIGMGCAHPADQTDVHLLSDCFALFAHSRPAPYSDVEVPAFNVTSLLPTAPKLLLNVESDDYGAVETRQCGCPLGSLGLTTHLRGMRSFRKLTGEGVTLVGSEMIHILENVLPARFGGSPLDYQLMEEEDEQGFTRLSLLIDPGLSIAAEEDVLKVVMEALAHGSAGADSARAIWQQAGTLRVRRAAPVWTARGKLMPLHIARNGDRST
jgi:hypothetical protein